MAIFLYDYWKMLQTWAGYLASDLPMSKKQLCTDDFEGPSPNNTLSHQGYSWSCILQYALLLDMKGNNTGGNYYRSLVQNYTVFWMNNTLVNEPGYKQHYGREYENVSNEIQFVVSIHHKVGCIPG